MQIVFKERIDRRGQTPVDPAELQVPKLPSITSLNVNEGKPIVESKLIAEKEKIRIIVVDDELDWRILMSKPLEDKYEVHTVRNGEECVSLLGWMLQEPNPPRLVITDLTMPQMDGIQLIKKARAMSANIKFILATVNQGLDVDDLVSEIKPNAFMRKPVDPTELNETVERLLKSESNNSASKNREHDSSDDKR